MLSGIAYYQHFYFIWLSWKGFIGVEKVVVISHNTRKSSKTLKNIVPMFIQQHVFLVKLSMIIKTGRLTLHSRGSRSKHQHHARLTIIIILTMCSLCKKRSNDDLYFFIESCQLTILYAINWTSIDESDMIRQLGWIGYNWSSVVASWEAINCQMNSKIS